jgi:hypothetical protein
MRESTAIAAINHTEPTYLASRRSRAPCCGPSINSAIDQTWLVTPIAIAGVMRNVSWTRHKLLWDTYKLTAAAWFSAFLLKPFV